MMKKIISIVILLAPAMYFGMNKQGVEMGIILVASLFSVIFMNFDEIKTYISVIKMRDMEIKFKDIIDEANTTIEQLNKTQYSLVKVATEILYRHKFWGGCNTKTSLELVDELYKNATSTNANEIIAGPIKLAYERLLSEAFGRISYGIVDKGDKEKIDEFINNIYEFKGGTNIFDVCDTIPEVNYIMREINSIDMSEESKLRVMENVHLYDTILKKYQGIYRWYNF